MEVNLHPWKMNINLLIYNINYEFVVFPVQSLSFSQI